MKCSESWLREWVDPDLTQQALCNLLTMAGLEIESIEPAAKPFKGVVVGSVMTITKHPEADRLHLCDVNIGTDKHLGIVCGAANVKLGMKIPVAQLGATLPGGIIIKPTIIRGIASEGMLCSAKELGLSDDSEGLLELTSDAPIGMDLREFLQLDDYTIDVSITPNRGDCLSVRGLAREISALTETTLNKIDIISVTPTIKDTLSIKVEASIACPRYVGRVIKGIKSNVESPTWLKERLRRCGIRSISPVVDITNYVMLELGQPMHAFDLNKIHQHIVVRESKAYEKINLLDGSEKVLDDNTLVIADAEKPLAIAGVMGGEQSSVTSNTNDIFLESAYFTAPVIARQRQFYQLNSDSAYRFERGIDPTIQQEAIERATQLILQIVGGEAGPVIEVYDRQHVLKQKVIKLKKNKIIQILGVSIKDKEIENIFNRLSFSFIDEGDYLSVQIPFYRPDITVPEDLIEEIARLYGYDNIPIHSLSAELNSASNIETDRGMGELRQLLKDQGFHEIISYSFIDKFLQKLLDPEISPRELLNPITGEMAVMRTNLWPGLVNTLIYNKNRQQHRVCLFEIGTCFVTQQNTLHQETRLGGLINGLAFDEQWGLSARDHDFYDLKGNVENIFRFFRLEDAIEFKRAIHPALHPGQTAEIYYKNQKIGILGALHPSVIQQLDLPKDKENKVFVFEIQTSYLKPPLSYILQEISKFPEIRRDLAFLVNRAIPSKDIQDTIRKVADDWLKDVFIFDVYQGKGIAADQKSIALALVLQHPTRTLVDDEVATLTNRVITALKDQLGAELRS